MANLGTIPFNYKTNAMQRILLVMDHDQVDVSAIDFACHLARTAHCPLTGIFVRDTVLELIPPIESDRPYGKESALRERDQEIRMDEEQTIRYFLDECALKDVKAEAWVDKGTPLEEVAFESRFADLLVLSPRTSYKGSGKIPTHFVKEVLERAECPVVITPHLFQKIDEVVFCYDGSASSLFAMKQFAYLFPQFHSLKTTVLEIRESRAPEMDEGHQRTMQWLKGHYKKVSTHHLPGTVKDELFTYFLKKQHLFIVMGAFGRTMFSQFFRPSSATALISTVDLPLFIAHH